MTFSTKKCQILKRIPTYPEFPPQKGCPTVQLTTEKAKPRQPPHKWKGQPLQLQQRQLKCVLPIPDDALRTRVSDRFLCIQVSRCRGWWAVSRGGGYERFRGGGVKCLGVQAPRTKVELGQNGSYFGASYTFKKLPQFVHVSSLRVLI